MPQELALTAPATPEQLITMAVASGANAEQLSILMDLQLKWQANQQWLAYNAALHKFKSDLPVILKTKKVVVDLKSGGQMVYSHAELDKIVPILTPALLTCGLSYSWRTGVEDGKVSVTCILTHESGHVQEISKLVGVADTSGSKSSSQAVQSTVTSFQRYTLLSGLGLAATGTDNDGATEGMDENSIEEYCDQMMAAEDWEELKAVFGECWRKAKACGDGRAQGKFNSTKEARKREILAK